MATIRDVARQAEVSIATVSRALNTPHLVAEPTRSRVVDAARRLGYASRGLRGGAAGARGTVGAGSGAGAAAGAGVGRSRTGFVGAVVPDLGNPFFPAVLRGMSSAPPAEGHEGRHVLSLDAVEDPAMEADLLRMIARQVDSLVLLAPRLPADRLRALSIPGRTVLFNRLIPGLPGVVVDCVDGMRRLVAHLGALGHRHIGYAGGPRASFGDAERRRGLNEATRSGGPHIADLGTFPPYFASGVHIADRALREGVTAVIAFNDLMALGTIVGLREREVDVPGRMSVTGFDGISLAAASTPRLTTVAPPLGRAGQTTMALLDAEVGVGGSRAVGGNGSGRAAGRWRVLPVRLVIGGSTGPAAAPQNKFPSVSPVR